MEIADPAAWPLESQTVVVIWETRRRRAPVLDDRLLKRIDRILEVGGSLIVAGLDNRMPQPKAETLEELVERLKGAGLEVEVSLGKRRWIRRPVLVMAKKSRVRDSIQSVGSDLAFQCQTGAEAAAPAAQTRSQEGRSDRSFSLGPFSSYPVQG